MNLLQTVGWVGVSVEDLQVERKGHGQSCLQGHRCALLGLKSVVP